MAQNLTRSTRHIRLLSRRSDKVRTSMSTPTRSIEQRKDERPSISPDPSQTHFGYQTIAESLKESKGMYITYPISKS